MRMSPFDSRSPGPGGMLLAGAAKADGAMPDSEAAVRNLKASESAMLAFAAAGIPSPSPALVNMVSDFVRQKTLGIPAGQMAAMTPGSGELAASAAAGVNMAVSGMNEGQRDAMQRGDHTLSARDMSALHAVFGRHGFGGPAFMRGEMNGQKDSASSSGARFDDMAGTSSPGNPSSLITPQGHSLSYMRSYALQQGIPWAASMPEILSMGPEAVKALADVQLKKQNYDTMRGTFHLTPGETVETAKRAKKSGVNLNDAVEQGKKLHGALPGHERGGFADENHRFMPRHDEQPARQRMHKYLNGLGERNPSLKPQIDRYRKKWKLELDCGIRCNADTDSSARRTAFR